MKNFRRFLTGGAIVLLLISLAFSGCATVSFIVPEDALEISIGKTVDSLPQLQEADQGTGALIENAKDYLVVQAYRTGGYTGFGTKAKSVTSWIPQVVQFNKGKIVNFFTYELVYETERVLENNKWVTKKIGNPIGVKLIPSPDSTININISTLTWAESKEDAEDIMFGMLQRK